MNIKKQLWLLILIATGMRLWVAASIEFGNDEVYYYIYALHLQSSYFDHPPVIAWLIRLTTFNLHFTSEVFVRSGAVMGAAIATWISFLIGKEIKSERAGLYAAILYNTSIYSCVLAGTFILPDSPQVVFWLAAVLVAIKLVKAFGSSGSASAKTWIWFGVLAGICTLCKVHGIFLWGGLGLYILLFERKQFSSPWLYVAGIITLCIISPIFIWNYHNHFITYTYHSERVEVKQAMIKPDDFLQAFIGQFLYNNPLNVVITVLALIQIRKRKILGIPITRMLLFMGLPIVFVVTAMSFFNQVLPHWSGPGFITLSVIAACYLDEKIGMQVSGWPSILRVSSGLIVFVLITGVLVINHFPGTISSNKRHLGSGDFTLDLSGWKSFSSSYALWQKQHPEYEHTKLIAAKWFPASHLEYYVARPLGKDIIGVGKLHDLHTYAWLNHYRNDLKPGEDALIIAPSNGYNNLQESFGLYFGSIRPLQYFLSNRGGKPTRTFAIYLAHGYKGNDEVHSIQVN